MWGEASNSGKNINSLKGKRSTHPPLILSHALHSQVSIPCGLGLCIKLRQLIFYFEHMGKD